MILYHVSTMYHLLCCLVHKLAYYPEEESRLLIVEYILMKEDVAPMVDWLRQQGWFSRIDIVPEKRFKLSRNASLDERSSKAAIEAVARHISADVEKWLGEDIRKYDKIYVAADHWSFGIYLLYRKIPYVYLEDGSGMLSQGERYGRIVKTVNKTNWVISEYYGGMGRSELVEKKLCDMANQQPGFSDPKAVDFTIYDTLREKIPHRAREILAFYGVSPMAARGKTCLFLSQYVRTLAIKEVAIQELLTALLVDYVCPDYDIVVKPHPKDRFVNYKRLLGERCTVLPADFPSEILPFVIDGEVDLALTASSTAIGGMKKFARQAVTFGTEIETEWENLHAMYGMAEVLRVAGYTAAEAHNVNLEQLEHIFHSAGLTIGESGAQIDGGREGPGQLRRCQMQVFASLGPAVNYPKGVPREQLAAVSVWVLPRKGSLLRRRHAVLFVWCQEKSIRERVLHIQAQRELRASRAQVRIFAHEIDKEQERRWLLQQREECKEE